MRNLFSNSKLKIETIENINKESKITVEYEKPEQKSTNVW